ASNYLGSVVPKPFLRESFDRCGNRLKNENLHVVLGLGKEMNSKKCVLAALDRYNRVGLRYKESGPLSVLTAGYPVRTASVRWTAARRWVTAPSVFLGR
ncbi:MAG TPA: hypothetical protein VIS99_15510, partial [Terrimicrobiaceae bacterium]